MNWKYVKLLFTVLLIAVNCLLANLIYESYSDNAFTDGATAERVSAILSESGINADPSLIAVKNDSARDYTAPFDRESYLLSVATFLLGEEPSGIFLLPNGIRAENALGEKAYVYFDMTLDFAGEGIDRDSLVARPITDEERASSVRSAFASLLGYEKEYLDGITMLEKDDLLIMTLTQSEDGIPLAGYECTFAMRDGKIVYAFGKHFFGTFDKSEEAPLLNRANILLSEKARGMSGSVGSVNLCYVLYEDTKQQRIHLAPAYSVSYKNGKTSIIDAKSAEVFE